MPASRTRALFLCGAAALLAGISVVSSCDYPTRVFGSPDDGSADQTSTGDAEQPMPETSSDDAPGDASVDGDASAESSPADADASADASPTEASPMDSALPPLDGPHPHCAPGKGEQPFSSTIFGCQDPGHPVGGSGGTTWATRATFCGPPPFCRVCKAQDWVDYQVQGGARPSANYWVDDYLLPSGAAPGSCAAVPTMADPNTGACPGRPMHVCISSPGSAAVFDRADDYCDLHNCGLGNASPDRYFGGCASSNNQLAGTLCCCGP